jgi:predicted transcriptional regulator
MEDRRTLHALLDELPESELPTARRVLEHLRGRSEDPLRFLLDRAPADDEEVTEEDLAAIREGLEEKARGEAISHEEVERLLLDSK